MPLEILPEHRGFYWLDSPFGRLVAQWDDEHLWWDMPGERYPLSEKDGKIKILCKVEPPSDH